MRKVTLFATLAGVAACATSPKRLGEPDHSYLHSMCLNNEVYNSVCSCAEAKAIDDTGITRIASDEEARKFILAVQSHLEECGKELEEELPKRE